MSKIDEASHERPNSHSSFDIDGCAADPVPLPLTLYPILCTPSSMIAAFTSCMCRRC